MHDVHREWSIHQPFRPHDGLYRDSCQKPVRVKMCDGICREGSNFCVFSRSIDSTPGQRRLVITVNQIVCYSGMVRLPGNWLHPIFLTWPRKNWWRKKWIVMVKPDTSGTRAFMKRYFHYFAYLYFLILYPWNSLRRMIKLTFQAIYSWLGLANFCKSAGFLLISAVLTPIFLLCCSTKLGMAAPWWVNDQASIGCSQGKCILKVMTRHWLLRELFSYATWVQNEAFTLVRLLLLSSFKDGLSSRNSKPRFYVHGAMNHKTSP